MTDERFCPEHGGPANDCEQCRDERERADDQAADLDLWQEELGSEEPVGSGWIVDSEGRHIKRLEERGDR